MPTARPTGAILLRSRKSKMPKARPKTKKAFPKKRRARPRTKRTPEDEENARRRRQRPKTRRPQPKMPRGPPQTISKGIASQEFALSFSKPLLRHLFYPMTEIFWIMLFFAPDCCRFLQQHIRCRVAPHLVKSGIHQLKAERSPIELQLRLQRPVHRIEPFKKIVSSLSSAIVVFLALAR